MKKLSIFLFAFFAFLSHVSATHIVGGELRYEFVSSANGTNTYKVELLVYRDCYNGVPLFDNPAAIGIFNSNNELISWDSVNYSFIDTLSFNPQSLCNIGPAGICFEVARYVTEISLPYDPSGYYLIYQRCCRNTIINNIPSPEDVGATYLVFISGESQLLHNSSPKWSSLPPVLICNHVAMMYDHSAIDSEGDSIVYSFCAPLNGGTSANPMPQPPLAPPYLDIDYNPGYSAEFPMKGTPPVQINPETGLITGTPDQIGHFVVSVCGKEYRDGILLSTFSRDFQFVVSDCVESVLVTKLNPSAHQECDTTYDFLNTSTEGGFHPYTWLWSNGETTEDIHNVQPGEIYTVTITDAAGCNSSVTFRGNDCVWPGDTDYNGVANNMDVLVLGLFNGDYGPVRPLADISWTPQPASFWSGYQNNGINLKHVDCDGSGFINNIDLDAISQNYDLGHPVAFHPVSVENAPDLFFNIPVSTLTPFQEISGEIDLGTINNPVENAYGIAFTIKSNKPEAKITITVNFEGSAFGNSAHTVSLQHPDPGFTGTDVAICNTSKLPFDKFAGKVCGMTLYSEEWKYPGAIDLIFENIRLIDQKGNTIPVNPLSTQIVVSQKNVALKEEPITLIPNPSNEFTMLTFATPLQNKAFIHVFDNKGRLITKEEIDNSTNDWKLNTGNFAEGNYLIRVIDDKSIFTGKLIVMHRN